MRAGGIRGASRAKKRFTTHPDKTAVRAQDLISRDFTAPAPNRKWVADFTYCSTWSGVIYVAFVTDVFSRRIVGWKAARSMSAALSISRWLLLGLIAVVVVALVTGPYGWTPSLRRVVSRYAREGRAWWWRSQGRLAMTAPSSGYARIWTCCVSWAWPWRRCC